jgi:hypothetical protein
MNDRGLGEAEQLRLGGGAFPNRAKRELAMIAKARKNKLFVKKGRGYALKSCVGDLEQLGRRQ